MTKEQLEFHVETFKLNSGMRSNTTVVGNSGNGLMEEIEMHDR
jgi:hypothetical protein